MRQVAAAMQGNEPDSSGERGVFVNVSSGAAWQGQRGQAAYSASKAGLIGLMLPVARDLARDGIRVVTVAPGVFDTAMLAGAGESAKAAISATVLNPTRLGDPDEFAALASHIVANQYLNATTISLDGGARG
jgi:NAD(P)-dependent dehydrogenase (short-subunit alcohol dehydrogenase family)